MSKKQQKWMPKMLIVAVALLVVVGAAVLLARDYYNRNLQPVSSSQTAVTVTIPTGSTLDEISALLANKRLIRKSSVFTQYVRSQNIQDQLQAGTYSLRPSQSVQEITDILVQGNVVKKLFTIIPGQRLDQIKSSMINAGFKTGEVEAAFNPALYSHYSALADKPDSASLEGYLYPDSYQRIAATTPRTIIGQSLDEMQKHLSQNIRDGFAAHGLTVHKGITLASIVEQEVAKPADRTQVAQVFLSRIGKGMKLESDVATKYGDILAGHAFSLSYDTPYNVYLHAGLPPTPIGNVTDSSMQAVAHPAGTSWLYFVSGDNGNTYFSNNLKDHESLTRQYCHKLCS